MYEAAASCRYRSGSRNKLGTPSCKACRILLRHEARDENPDRNYVSYQSHVTLQVCTHLHQDERFLGLLIAGIRCGQCVISWLASHQAVVVSALFTKFSVCRITNMARHKCTWRCLNNELSHGVTFILKIWFLYIVTQLPACYGSQSPIAVSTLAHHLRLFRTSQPLFCSLC
jgi:hypothetical protein